MSLLLLSIIYLLFISLGLPDSFIGSSWPVMHTSLGVNEGFQGVLSIVPIIFSIISSFLTSPLQKKFSTFQIVTVSTLLTVVGLFGFFLAPNVPLILLSLIPLGLGQGAIDASLNNYVAVNYRARHLHFLHACWSMGAIVAPIITSQFLTNPNGWRNSLFILGLLQGFILLISIISKPLWSKENEISRKEETNNNNNLKFWQIFKIKGVIAIIFAFFMFIAVESMTLNWFASMMVFAREINPDDASNWTSLIFVGYTVGRIVSGLLSNKITDRWMIRLATIIYVSAVLFLMLNKITDLYPIIAFTLGFGLGPIYPAIVHDTPNKFTSKYSGHVMSVQIGCAYISMVTISPLFGVIGEKFGFDLLPIFLLVTVVATLLFAELANIQTKDKSKL